MIRNVVDERRAIRQTAKAPEMDRYGNIRIETENEIYTNKESEYRELTKDYYRSEYMKKNYQF